MKKRIVKTCFVIAIICIIIVKMFFVDYMMISGNSMSKTYKNGDLILIDKNFDKISRYDVIIAYTKEHGLKGKVIKRVIGLPNEIIQIIDGYVYINGHKLQDDVFNSPMEYAGIAEQKIILSDDEYFLLGDNRNKSEDSRYKWLGLVKYNQIIGKPICKLISH